MHNSAGLSTTDNRCVVLYEISGKMYAVVSMTTIMFGIILKYREKYSRTTLTRCCRINRFVIEYATRTPLNMRKTSVYNAQILTIIDDDSDDFRAIFVRFMIGTKLSTVL